MTFIIIMGILVGFGFLIGIVVYCIIQMLSLHGWKRTHEKGWYHTWTR